MNTISILLIEDNDVDQELVKQTIEQNTDFHITFIATNGKEGLDFLNANKSTLPSLILLDINMPIMNGMEFLKQLKSSSLFKKIPVVALTTSCNEQDVKKCYELGISGYFVKPFSIEKYQHTFQTILEYWKINQLP